MLQGSPRLLCWTAAASRTQLQAVTAWDDFWAGQSLAKTAIQAFTSISKLPEESPEKVAGGVGKSADLARKSREPCSSTFHWRNFFRFILSRSRVQHLMVIVPLLYSILIFLRSSHPRLPESHLQDWVVHFSGLRTWVPEFSFSEPKQGLHFANVSD